MSLKGMLKSVFLHVKSVKGKQTPSTLEPSSLTEESVVTVKPKLSETESLVS